MLTEIASLLRERGPMSLADLSIHFRTDAAALEGMLRMLERKGRVERIGGSRCGGCAGCASVRPEDRALYRAACRVP